MGLWTTQDAATYWGVSESRARAILAKAGVDRVSGYDPIAVQNIPRLGRGARTDLRESVMTVTTTIPGPSGDTELHGWYSYINEADYTAVQEKEVAESLLHEQVNEFNALLPDGWTWDPSTCEIILPADHEDASEMDFAELSREACETVVARFDTIETEALARV